jgi:cation transport ATPase
MSTTISRWKYLLYPELRKFTPDDRARVLRTAAEVRFDAIELLGLITALAVTVLITRYSGTGMGLADRFGAAVANFVIAIPLLLLLGGPFYVRRTRRGLRKQLAELQRPVTE